MNENKKDIKESKHETTVSKPLKEKIFLLFLGTVVTIMTFLLSSFTGNYVTLANYNKDQAVWHRVLEKIKNIEDDIKEIKTDIKEQ